MVEMLGCLSSVILPRLDKEKTFCIIGLLLERKKMSLTILESDCCYAEVKFQDICSRCGEHCEPTWVEYEEDNGQPGFVPGA
jgi:hypothetical protein